MSTPTRSGGHRVQEYSREGGSFWALTAYPLMHLLLGDHEVAKF